MDERKQFTFYASFYEALSRIKKKADRAEAYDILCQYALCGTEPDMEALPDAVAIAFSLIKPNLTASRRKAESGKRGGKGKQTESKPEATSKQEDTGTKKEVEKEIEVKKEVEIEIEKENECSISSGGGGRDGKISPAPAAGAEKRKSVWNAYRAAICPEPSRTCREELRGYVEALGSEVCMRAIDIAVDNNKRQWAYIRAILEDKKRRGITSLAQWDQASSRRGAPEPEPDKYAQTPEEVRKNMEQLARLREKMRKGDAENG